MDNRRSICKASIRYLKGATFLRDSHLGIRSLVGKFDKPDRVNMARCLIAFTALLAVGAGILTAHYILLDEQPLGIQDTKFDEVAPNLYRLGSTWTLIRKVVEAHVAVFLVKRGKDYILIDAGVPGANYTDMLIGAVNAATKDGNLRLVLCKHFLAIICNQGQTTVIVLISRVIQFLD